MKHKVEGKMLSKSPQEPPIWKPSLLDRFADALLIFALLCFALALVYVAWFLWEMRGLAD